MIAVLLSLHAELCALVVCLLSLYLGHLFAKGRDASKIAELTTAIAQARAELAAAKARLHEFDAVDSARVGLREAAAPLLAHLDDIIACCRLCQPTQSGGAYIIQHSLGIETAAVGLEALLDRRQLMEFRKLRERLANDPNNHAKQVAERAEKLRTFLARL